MGQAAAAFDVEALRAALVIPAGSWARLDVVARTGSTNADLIAAAAAGALDRTVLVAEHQDAGRGRFRGGGERRSWISPPASGLTVSVLLRPEGVPPSRFGWLPLLAGLALLDTVRACTTAPAALKWPNDLLLGERQLKAAGILAEVVDGPVPAVVVGIGLNVTAAPPDVAGATCLAVEGAPDADHAAVLVALLARLAEREARWRDGAGDPQVTGLRADYLAGCASVGSEVRVELPGGKVTIGVAEGVDGDGRLLLLDATGRRQAVAAGDVVHLRPAG